MRSLTSLRSRRGRRPPRGIRDAACQRSCRGGASRPSAFPARCQGMIFRRSFLHNDVMILTAADPSAELLTMDTCVLAKADVVALQSRPSLPAVGGCEARTNEAHLRHPAAAEI